MRVADVIALDIVDFTERKVGTIPAPHVGGFQQPSLSGDGSWLALAKQRDERTWEIGRMHVQTGEYRTVITQGFRIGHVQYSPTDDAIFYVWETGGYAPQRTWLVDADGTGNRPFYARTDTKTWITPLKEWITHEAWIAGTGEMTMINDKQGVMIVDKTGNARMVKEGDSGTSPRRPMASSSCVDDNKGRLWLMETCDRHHAPARHRPARHGPRRAPARLVRPAGTLRAVPHRTHARDRRDHRSPRPATLALVARPTLHDPHAAQRRRMMGRPLGEPPCHTPT